MQEANAGQDGIEEYRCSCGDVQGRNIIPAGADVTSLLADEDYFYGYFFFANAVGATIEAIA